MKIRGALTVLRKLSGKFSDAMSFSDTKLNALKVGYTAVREAAGFLNTAYETAFKKQHDYERVIEAGEKLLKKMPDYFLEYEIPDGIGTEVFGMYFQSPVILSSFKGDIGVIGQYMKMGLGGATIKTVMPEFRYGNKRPRIKIDEDGIRNRMGLPGPGAKKVRAELEDSDIFSFDRPIGISIGGETVEEYLEVFKAMRELETLSFDGKKPKIYYEINASCPNTGKTPLCEDDTMFKKVLEAIHKVSDGSKDVLYYAYCDALEGIHKESGGANIFVKLSLNLSDEKILERADVCESYGMGLTLGNTRKDIFGSNPENPEEMLPCGKSGQTLKARTIEMVNLVRNHGYSLPVIAIGGLSNAADVKGAIDAGANLVGMATAVVQNPYEAIVQTNLDLARMMNN